MNELITINKIENNQLAAVDIFQSDGLESILKSIEDEAKSNVLDPSTKKGRDEIKSLAHKIARSKTTLDGLGKDLVAEWKSKSKLVDSERKKAREFLDNLKEEVRKPVTDWENAEKKRIEDLEYRVEKIRELSGCRNLDMSFIPLEQMESNLKELESIVVDESFSEFQVKAEREKKACIESLTLNIDRVKKEIAEKEELERLRKQEEERKQKEREEEIARKAAEEAERKERERQEKIKRKEEEARLEAQRKEHEEQEKIRIEEERKRKDAERKAEQARLDAERKEREKQEAIERAEREKKEAIEAERRKIAEEKRKEESERIAREKDTANKKRVNNLALDALVAGGLDVKNAKLVVKLIASKKIPNVVINY